MPYGPNSAKYRPVAEKTDFIKKNKQKKKKTFGTLNKAEGVYFLYACDTKLACKQLLRLQKMQVFTVFTVLTVFHHLRVRVR